MLIKKYKSVLHLEKNLFFCKIIKNNHLVSLKNAFVVIHLTRYYQAVSVYTFQTLNNIEKVILF